MEDDFARGFLAFLIMAGAAALVGVLCLFTAAGVMLLRDWWQIRRDMHCAKRLVAQNVHKPLSVCSCLAIPGFGTDPSCPIHGAAT